MSPLITTVPLSEPEPEPDADSGKPLLVLGPALGTTVRTLWGPCAALLADRFRVLGWDLPGHGGTPPPTGTVTVAGLAAALAAALPEDEPVHYAGDSVGGAVGLHLLLDHPDRVATATLLCTGARIGEAEGWAQRAATVRADGTAALVESAPSRWFAPGFTDRAPDTAAALLADLRATGDEGYARVCEALAAFDVRDRVGAITRPVLAVAGRHDTVTPAAGLRAVTANLVTLDDVAHLAPAEAPHLVAALIAGHADTAAPTGYRAGLRVRREVLGAAHVDRALGAATDLTADFQEFITRYAWGGVWTRPGLDRRTRSLITLTALVAGGHHDELALHLRAARRNGVPVAEIRETLLHSAIYVGVPAANTAFRIAAEVLAEEGEAGGRPNS